jgi:predicted nucleotidyltransferase
MISFKSKIAKALLKYFFLNPKDELFVNEIVRKLKVDKRNLVKKIKEIENEGLLKSQARGNLKVYSIDQSYPLYEEYKKIVFKTVGVEVRLKNVVQKIPGIKKVILFGSYAKNTMDFHSDIDILIIGEYKVIDLQKEINKLQRETGREINVVNMDEKDFKQRKQNKDPFLRTVLEEKYIEVI